MEAFMCRVGSSDAVDIIGCSYRQLDYWCRGGIVSCTTPADGSGSRREFDFLDLIRARAVAHLRGAGVPLQRIRRVLRELEEKYRVDDPLIQTGRLVVAGDTLFWAVTDQELLNVLTGQMALRQVTVLPVGELVRDTRRRVLALCAA